MLGAGQVAAGAQVAVCAVEGGGPAVLRETAVVADAQPEPPVVDEQRGTPVGRG